MEADTILKMIIADDERVIRETISTIIDWKQYDIQLVGLCKNGLEAYDMILDESPDIVLTDIRMPGMDAMELIEKAAEIDSPPQFILLSGYGEFEYAKKAMKYGVRHYLLKPCRQSQILESIQDVAKDCYQKKQLQIQTRPQPHVSVPRPLPSSSAMAQQIFEYVEQHISDSNLTLKYICDHCLFMNTDYVSRKFQKETGQKFSSYLTEMRIKKAKEYLAASDPEKIVNVAKMVGCGNNPQYFSQLFRKQTGMTPSAYVAKIHGWAEEE